MATKRLWTADGAGFVDVPEEHPNFAGYRARYPADSAGGLKEEKDSRGGAENAEGEVTGETPVPPSPPAPPDPEPETPAPPAKKNGKK